jgi:hypothetical protein
MYLTRNTEYHFRDDVCVAVRDRRTGSWLVSHLALERRLGGSVRFLRNGAAVPSEDTPQLGEALYFGLGGQELVTSALCGIGRPQKPIVESYPLANNDAARVAS